MYFSFRGLAFKTWKGTIATLQKPRLLEVETNFNLDKVKVGTEFFKINDLISVYCNNFKMCVSCTYSMKMINRRERKKVKARILVYLR